jgi:hypothetical protein
VRREIAQEIVGVIEKCIEQISELIPLVEEHCSAEEIKAFRRGIGFSLSEIQDRIMDPIYREHMDLIPADVDYAPLPGPILSKIGRKDDAP